MRSMTLRSVCSAIVRACEADSSGSQIRTSTSCSSARTKTSRSLPLPKNVRGSGWGRRCSTSSTSPIPAVRHSSRSSARRASVCRPPSWTISAIARVPVISSRARTVAAASSVSRSRTNGMNGTGRVASPSGSSVSAWRASTASGVRGQVRVRKAWVAVAPPGASAAMSTVIPAGPRCTAAIMSMRSLDRSASSSRSSPSGTRWVTTSRMPRRRPTVPRTRSNSGTSMLWASPRTTRWTRPRRSSSSPTRRPSSWDRSSRSRASVGATMWSGAPERCPSFCSWRTWLGLRLAVSP